MHIYIKVFLQIAKNGKKSFVRFKVVVIDCNIKYILILYNKEVGKIYLKFVIFFDIDTDRTLQITSEI